MEFWAGSWSPSPRRGRAQQVVHFFDRAAALQSSGSLPPPSVYVPVCMICVFCQMGQGAEKKEFGVAVVGSVLGINEPYALILPGRLSPRVMLSAFLEDFILHSQHTRDPSPGGLLGGISTDA